MSISEAPMSPASGPPRRVADGAGGAAEAQAVLAAIDAFRAANGDDKDADERERRFERLLDALPTALYTTDAEGRVTFFNEAAADLAGRRPIIGRDVWCVTWRLYWPDGRRLAFEDCPMAIALRENRIVRGVEAVAERPDGTRTPILPFPTPLYDACGALIGGVNVLVDISERKAAEYRQRMLFDELNHRVRNNLQMLAGLLGVAERETDNPEAKTVLADAARRVAAAGAAQKALYDTRDPVNFDAAAFLKSACETCAQVLGDDVKLIRRVTLDSLPNDAAMPLALILNELIANAVKHGRSADGQARIEVGLTSDERSHILYVRDEGPGFGLEAPRRRASGLGLVMGLARQLGGALEVQSDDGARCTVRFGDFGAAYAPAD